MQVSHKSAYLLRHSVRRTGSVCGHYLHPCFIHILEHCQMKSMPSFTEPSEYPAIVHNSQVAEHALTKATPPPTPPPLWKFPDFSPLVLSSYKGVMLLGTGVYGSFCLFRVQSAPFQAQQLGMMLPHTCH